MTVVNHTAAGAESQARESGWVTRERLRSALAERSIALDRELGRGGMSIVYLARDLRHDRLVSGSYSRSGDRISFQAEITDANQGTLIDAVGPVAGPVNRPGEAIDSLVLHVEADLRRQLRARGGSGS